MDKKYLAAFFASIVATALLLNAVVFAYVLHYLSASTALTLAPIVFVAGLTIAVRAMVLRRRAVQALPALQRLQFDDAQLPKLLRSARLLRNWLVYLPFGFLAALWRTWDMPPVVRVMPVVMFALLFTLLYRSRRASLKEIERIERISSTTSSTAPVTASITDSRSTPAL